jgi:hypothetical protein
MDEHPKARLPPPFHARVPLRGSFVGVRIGIGGGGPFRRRPGGTRAARQQQSQGARREVAKNFRRVHFLN